MSLKKKKKRIQDNPHPVQISEPSIELLNIKLDAIRVLADEKNEIFSEIQKFQVPLFTLGFVYAANPTPALNDLLVNKGLPVIQCGLLNTSMTQYFQHLHKVKRRRVKEYIDGLSTLKPESSSASIIQQGRGMMGRMLG